MNANVVAYIIYLTVTLYIIYWIGKQFHRKGRVFILNLYHGNQPATDAVNNLLLVAYYLFNIGYAFLRIRTWEYLHNYAQLITSLSAQIGTLILVLSVTHYFNMGVIYMLSKKQPFILHHKKKMS